MRFHQPAGLSLRVAAPSLPSRSPACRMILAVFDLSHVYRAIGCLCSRLHETAGRFHSLVAHRPFLMFGLSPAGRTILESCRSVSVFSLTSLAGLGWGIKEKPTGNRLLGPSGNDPKSAGDRLLGPGRDLQYESTNLAYIWPQLEYQRDHQTSPHQTRWDESEVCWKQSSWARLAYQCDSTEFRP